ncbi:MAG: hypothetical protein ACK4M2_07690, partial [Brevundimonas sp.]
LGRAYMGLLIWLAPLGLVIGAVLTAAVARSVLRPAESALGYLRLGMDEVRVLGVTLAITVILGLLGGVLLTIVLTVFGLGIASGQAVMYLIALILGLGAAALVIWLSVKLCLAVPMTIDRGKFTLFESFKDTNGQFWPLLGMTIIALIMSLIVSILGTIISAGTDLATGGISVLAGMDGLSTLDVLARAWPAILVWSVVNALMSALQLAVLYAPFSAAWQGLRDR